MATGLYQLRASGIAFFLRYDHMGSTGKAVDCAVQIGWTFTENGVDVHRLAPPLADLLVICESGRSDARERHRQQAR